ncbi:MAG: hypothetical protein LBO72_02605 [Helicobacteraceae bacterium]|nr:hypothetical protein [Helicobacteraceae bacterium]
MHWTLSFYPFIYILAFGFLSIDEIAKSIRFMIFFMLAHIVLIAALLSLPVSLLERNKNYATIVFGVYPQEVIAHMPQSDDFIWASTSYANAALLEYHSNRRTIVFGKGSYHAREDDRLTDFRKLDGKNIATLLRRAPDEKLYTPFFGSVATKTFVVRNQTFYVVEGYGFRYNEYRDNVLTDIRDQYYNLPSFLPCDRCYFFDRYFPK